MSEARQQDLLAGLHAAFTLDKNAANGGRLPVATPSPEQSAWHQIPVAPAEIDQTLRI